MHNALVAEKQHTVKMISNKSLDIEIWVMDAASLNHIVGNVVRLIVKLESLVRLNKVFVRKNV